MSWSLAMDEQTTMVEFWRSSMGRKYGRDFVELLQEDYDRSHLGFGDDLDALSKMQELMVGGAEPMYVNHDVCELISRARESWKPEPLLPQDIIVPWGFARFPQSLGDVDSLGHPMPVAAISWAPYTKRLLDPKAMDDVPELMKQIGAVLNGHRVEETVLLDEPDKATGLCVSLYSRPLEVEQQSGLGDMTDGAKMWPLVMTHWTRQPFGVNAVDELYEHQADDEGAIASAQQFDSLIQVFFRLMQQKIIVRQPELATRPAWKRSKRANLNHKRVLVVTLRRPKGPKSNNSTPVDWSHRWLVGGHWRNQWYPSEGVHRQIWISDYEKGPEDKPLIIKQRAFEFRR